MGMRSEYAAYEFWVDEGKWPMDTQRYVFLARAFRQIGSARFGEQWTNNEPFATRRAAPELVALLSKRTTELSFDEVARLRELRAHDEAAIRPLIAQAEARARAVQEEVVRQCEAGVLRSALRPVHGGAMAVLPPAYWNGADPRRRFYLCQMDRFDPFGSGLAGEGFGYIFIERESLEAYLLSQPFAPKHAELDFHLSPYMQTLITVARKMAIAPDNQPKKEAVIAELKAIWTGPEPLGKTMAEYMATILREPESQLGRARKKKV